MNSLFISANMDYVQMYISWLNKVDKLTLLTSFSHKMASINRKNLIVGYLFSITQLFDKFLANYWIFYLFEQIRTMYICTYHDSIRRSCWRHLEVLTSLWSPSSGKKYNSDILIFLNRALIYNCTSGDLYP